MSNTDFEDAPNGETAEELVLDTTDTGKEAGHETDATDSGDAEVNAQPEGGQEEVRRPSRRDARIQTLLEAGKVERERSERLEREIMEIKAAQQAARQQPSPEQETERLAMMTPEERSEYKL